MSMGNSGYSPSEKRDFALEKLLNVASDILLMCKPLIQKAIDEELKPKTLPRVPPAPRC